MHWIFYEKETETKARVFLIYNVEPPQELLDTKEYIEVPVVPTPTRKEGKSAVLYCNPETKELWYEYVNRPLTSEELLNKKIQEQEQAIAELTLLLSTAMQGGVE